MTVNASINIRAHEKLGKMKMRQMMSSVTINGIDDTNAQTFTAGLDILPLLNYNPGLMIRTRHRSHAVDSNSLNTKGAIVVNFSVGPFNATEIVYICDKVKGLYLSKTALKKLNIIDPNFPHCHDHSFLNSLDNDEQQPPLADCGCPKRSPCPPIPEKHLFPATPNHRGDIERWIKQYFN